MNIEVIKEILRSPKNEYVVVQFKKLNGELRYMKCTLCIDRIPEDKIPAGKDVLEEVIGSPPKVETACRVFDLDKQEWRSFRYDSILFITEYPMPIVTHPNIPTINRIEVIDENGREYVKYTAKPILYSLQDDGKTLKIFVNHTALDDSGKSIDELFS